MAKETPAHLAVGVWPTLEGATGRVEIGTWVVDRDIVVKVLFGSTTTWDSPSEEASVDDVMLVASVTVPSPSMPLGPSVPEDSPPDTHRPGAPLPC